MYKVSSQIIVVRHYLVNGAAAAVARLIACIAAIETWLDSNRLKMNSEKIHFICLGSRNQQAAFHIAPLHLPDGIVIAPSTNFCNLGAIFDIKMTMSDHVSSVTRTYFYLLRQLSFVQHSLSGKSAKMLVHAFVSSRVDYHSSLLYGARAHVTRKLQAVLNASVRLITGVGHYDHVTSVLRDRLHWLPVNQRIIYKIELHVYKCLHRTGPAYLKDYCITLTTDDLHLHLRFVVRGNIARPGARTCRLGPRSFGSASTSVWNFLPLFVRNAQSLGQ